MTTDTNHATQAARAGDGNPEPFWYAVVSERAPVINSTFRRADVAEKWADKHRVNWPDVEVVPLYRAAAPAVSAVDDWRRYATEREDTAQQVIERHRREIESLLRLLAADRRTIADLRAAPAVSAPADLPPGVVVSAYRVGDEVGAIKIERVQQIEGPDLWAVRKHYDVLNSAGEWEWEPRPSERDDDFIRRCRFATHTEALAALYAAENPPPATVAAAEGGANG